MNNRQKYQTLKKRLAKVNAQQKAIRDRFDEMELQLQLPKLKKKYLGKYFKFRNSYGSDREGWWLYLFVKSIDATYHGRGCSFQTDIHGKSEFELDAYISFGNLIEITDEEYTKALRLFLAAAAKLTN